uniref:Amino acid permease/ SLC12A domain-containing protein n=1 Tax=Fibrocapsa japonica TaxID=94617 RepID=A0A7S2Y0M4_9STRA|mmetsp:Transcript_8796/g.13532  ORF Transcript_8796/g.13532 Transcript_8796/m.13532 type:complete len:497 (+) Transcript_8796:42-1532(+)
MGNNSEEGVKILPYQAMEIATENAPATNISVDSMTVQCRAPKAYISPFYLWAVSVGGVIGGNFFGWNTALEGGYGGALLAFFISFAFYTCFVAVVSELSTRIPKAGGGYIFALESLGDCAGCFAGMAQAIKTISATASLVAAIADYITGVWGWDVNIWGPVIWALLLLGLLAVNIKGVQASFKFQTAILLLAIVLLVVFYGGSMGALDFEKNAVPRGWFPGGAAGVLQGVPFMMWMFLGVEEVVQAVEEVKSPVKDIPLGAGVSVLTCAAFGFLTSTLSVACAPGIITLTGSDSPLLDSYEAVFGGNALVETLGVLVVAGLVCSLHTFVYYSGQVVYALARDSFLPPVLARLHSTWNTPYLSLVSSSGASFLLAGLFQGILGSKSAISVLVSIGLVSALISYGFQLVAFMNMRWSEKDMGRTLFLSPLGQGGAIIAITLLMFFTFCLLYLSFMQLEYLIGLVLVAVVFIATGLYYFLVVAPKKKSEIMNHSLVQVN